MLVFTIDSSIVSFSKIGLNTPNADNAIAENATKYNVNLYGFVYLSNRLNNLKSNAFPDSFPISYM